MPWALGPEACGIPAPGPGIEPSSPALEGRVSTPGPPGKSLRFESFIFQCSDLVKWRVRTFYPVLTGGATQHVLRGSCTWTGPSDPVWAEEETEMGGDSGNQKERRVVLTPVVGANWRSCPSLLLSHKHGWDPVSTLPTTGNWYVNKESYCSYYESDDSLEFSWFLISLRRAYEDTVFLLTIIIHQLLIRCTRKTHGCYEISAKGAWPERSH